MSGQPRSLERNFKSIQENLIIPNQDKFQIDLLGILQPPLNFKYNKPELLTFTKAILYDKDPELPSLTYQSKNYRHLLPDWKSFHHFTTDLSKIVYYQLFHIQRINNLRKEYEIDNNIQYDYIARIRPDFEYLTKIDLSILKPNTIFIPYKNDWEGYNDRFAIGDRNVMEIYMNRFDFWMKEHPNISPYTTHVENNLKIYLDSNKISTERIPFSYSTLRENGFQEAKVII